MAVSLSWGCGRSCTKPQIPRENTAVQAKSVSASLEEFRVASSEPEKADSPEKRKEQTDHTPSVPVVVADKASRRG